MPLTTIPKRQTLLEMLKEPGTIEDGAPEGAKAVAPIDCEPVVLEAIGHLDDALSPNLLPANIELIARAVRVAYQAHDGVVRKSGEPYIIHPIETAAILAMMQLDAETLAAGILHDVVEDTEVTLRRHPERVRGTRREPGRRGDQTRPDPLGW